MRSKVEMSEELRQQPLSASTSGENAAEKGLIGKIRVMIAEAMLSLKNSTDTAVSDLPPEIDEGAPLSPASGMDAYVWSMQNYKEEIQNQMDDSEDAAEAWDELEKSIVGKLADEVSVRIIGASVEIIVYKEFHD